MDIELDPPRGITGFPLGMPAEEVKEAAIGPDLARSRAHKHQHSRQH